MRVRLFYVELRAFIYFNPLDIINRYNSEICVVKEVIKNTIINDKKFRDIYSNTLNMKENQYYY